MDRAEILAALGTAGRHLSTATVLFHTAVAEQFGLNTTDWKCADLLTQTGPITAGELAELSGLTTGAITGVVDRLEKVGFARREPDPNDRRRVIIHPALNAALEAQVDEVLAGLTEGVAETAAKYNDDELALILDYIRESTKMLSEEAVRLRKRSADS